MLEDTSTCRRQADQYRGSLVRARMDLLIDRTTNEGYDEKYSGVVAELVVCVYKVVRALE